MAVDEENDAPDMGAFVLRLRLGGTEPPQGTLTALGATVTHPFYGWIELMSAINTLRGWDNPKPDEHRPPEGPAPNPGTEQDPDSHTALDP